MPTSPAFAVAALVGCAVGCSTPGRPAPAGTATGAQVEHYGELRRIMHEGQTGPVVAVATALEQPHAFAVGALSGLRGEITIVDGAVWLSIADGGTARVERLASTPDTAALLVVSHVPRWRELALPHAAGDAALDDAIEQAVRAAGIDPAVPFPLQLVATGTVRWHVLAGTPAHGDHAEGAITGVIERAPVRLVGFFAKGAEGVYTHHGHRTHVHVIDEAGGVMGHADAITLDAGATLLVPDAAGAP